MRSARSSVDEAPSNSPWASSDRACVTSERVAGEKEFWRGGGGTGVGEPGDGEPGVDALGTDEFGAGELPVAGPGGCVSRAGAAQAPSSTATRSARAGVFSE